jgi:hypothetical protein
MARDRTIEQGGSSKTDSQTHCCHCRAPLTNSGWCDQCNLWPINITPRRWCHHAHLVRSDGFCQSCGNFVLTELLPERGEWKDTRNIPHVITKQRISELVQSVSDAMDRTASVNGLPF